MLPSNAFGADAAFRLHPNSRQSSPVRHRSPVATRGFCASPLGSSQDSLNISDWPLSPEQPVVQIRTNHYRSSTPAHEGYLHEKERGAEREEEEATQLSDWSEQVEKIAFDELSSLCSLVQAKSARLKEEEASLRRSQLKVAEAIGEASVRLRQEVESLLRGAYQEMERRFSTQRRRLDELLKKTQDELGDSLARRREVKKLKEDLAARTEERQTLNRRLQALQQRCKAQTESEKAQRNAVEDERRTWEKERTRLEKRLEQSLKRVHLLEAGLAPGPSQSHSQPPPLELENRENSHPGLESLRTPQPGLEIRGARASPSSATTTARRASSRGSQATSTPDGMEGGARGPGGKREREKGATSSPPSAHSAPTGSIGPSHPCFDADSSVDFTAGQVTQPHAIQTRLDESHYCRHCRQLQQQDSQQQTSHNFLQQLVWEPRQLLLDQGTQTEEGRALDQEAWGPDLLTSVALSTQRARSISCVEGALLGSWWALDRLAQGFDRSLWGAAATLAVEASLFPSSPSSSSSLPSSALSAPPNGGTREERDAGGQRQQQQQKQQQRQQQQTATSNTQQEQQQQTTNSRHQQTQQQEQVQWASLLNSSRQSGLLANCPTLVATSHLEEPALRAPRRAARALIFRWSWCQLVRDVGEAWERQRSALVLDFSSSSSSSSSAKAAPPTKISPDAAAAVEDTPLPDPERNAMAWARHVSEPRLRGLHWASTSLGKSSSERRLRLSTNLGPSRREADDLEEEEEDWETPALPSLRLPTFDLEAWMPNPRACSTTPLEAVPFDHFFSAMPRSFAKARSSRALEGSHQALIAPTSVQNALGARLWSELRGVLLELEPLLRRNELREEQMAQVIQGFLVVIVLFLDQKPEEGIVVTKAFCRFLSCDGIEAALTRCPTSLLFDGLSILLWVEAIVEEEKKASAEERSGNASALQVQRTVQDSLLPIFLRAAAKTSCGEVEVAHGAALILATAFLRGHSSSPRLPPAPLLGSLRRLLSSCDGDDDGRENDYRARAKLLSIKPLLQRALRRMKKQGEAKKGESPGAPSGASAIAHLEVILLTLRSFEPA